MKPSLAKSTLSSTARPCPGIGGSGIASGRADRANSSHKEGLLVARLLRCSLDDTSKLGHRADGVEAAFRACFDVPGRGFRWLLRCCSGRVSPSAAPGRRQPIAFTTRLAHTNPAPPHATVAAFSQPAFCVPGMRPERSSPVKGELPPALFVFYRTRSSSRRVPGDALKGGQAMGETWGPGGSFLN